MTPPDVVRHEAAQAHGIPGYEVIGPLRGAASTSLPGLDDMWRPELFEGGHVLGDPKRTETVR